jgi:DNA-binding PadR family transcriptional regulator
MKQQIARRSPLALAVLALLYEAPMHPYRMQQLFRERGKDKVINVRDRANIYQTVERLLRDGLIAIAEITRDERWPERTVYELTERGRAMLQEWMRDMLSTPAHEFPTFPTALAYLALLTPKDALHQLELRLFKLTADVAGLEAETAAASDALPRLFLIESEYLLALARTELAWVRALADDLRAGRLTWSDEWLRAVASASVLEETREKREEGRP